MLAAAVLSPVPPALNPLTLTSSSHSGTSLAPLCPSSALDTPSLCPLCVSGLLCSSPLAHPGHSVESQGVRRAECHLARGGCAVGRWTDFFYCPHRRLGPLSAQGPLSAHRLELRSQLRSAPTRSIPGCGHPLPVCPLLLRAGHVSFFVPVSVPSGCPVLSAPEGCRRDTEGHRGTQRAKPPWPHFSGARSIAGRGGSPGAASQPWPPPGPLHTEGARGH